MTTEISLRREVKKYIDEADIKVVKMLHAMLEVDADLDWWDTMPNNIKVDVETALKQSESGKVIPHADVQKLYKKWIVK